jgi:hypothetical protein
LSQLWDSQSHLAAVGKVGVIQREKHGADRPAGGLVGLVMRVALLG